MKRFLPNVHPKPIHAGNPTPRIRYDRTSAAHQLGISVRTLEYRIAQGQLATTREGSKVMITHSELMRYARCNHTDRTSPHGEACSESNALF